MLTMDTILIKLLGFFWPDRPKGREKFICPFKNVTQRRICTGYYKRIITVYYLLYRRVVSQEFHQQICPFLLTNNFKDGKVKRSGLSALYYPNSCVVRQVLLQWGDISLNLAPVRKKKTHPSNVINVRKLLGVIKRALSVLHALAKLIINVRP